MIEIVHRSLPARGRLHAGPLPAAPLAAAAAALRAVGVTAVACLLERSETPFALEAAYARAGLPLLRFPVPDMGVPADELAFRVFLLDLLSRLGAGESLYLHCLAGLGRTGAALACLFVLAGESPATAVAAVRACYRPEAVERPEQRRFVETFAGRG